MRRHEKVTTTHDNAQRNILGAEGTTYSLSRLEQLILTAVLIHMQRFGFTRHHLLVNELLSEELAA